MREVSLGNLRCRLFERTEETKRLEKEIRIKTYKDYLLDRTEEDIPI